MRKVIITMTLPQVGDKLLRRMTASEDQSGALYQPEHCIVAYVNKEHHWYQVTFINSGIRECYGVPVFDHCIYSDIRKNGSSPVVCLETGVVWSSIYEAAKDLGLGADGISRQISGYQSQCNGYHFETII